MKKFFGILFIFLISLANAQEFNGKIYTPDNSILYLNQVYVTNLRTQKTVIANYQGNFSLPARVGDIIRFTSIFTERRDIELTRQLLERKNMLIKLDLAYYDIPEVVINGFRPTGNLKRDVLTLPPSKKIILAEKIGLPEPKNPDMPSRSSIVDFQNGGIGLGIQSLFDIISGERKRQERLQTYETMQKGVESMRKFFGDEYFTEKKIPENLIDNFLQFVYISDNLGPVLRENKFVLAEISINKYLPVYLRRLQTSRLEEVVQ